MKGWHIGGILVLVLVYLIGVKFPGPGNTVLGKLGI